MLPMYTDCHIKDFNDLDCINEPDWYEKIFTIEELNYSHGKHLTEYSKEKIEQMLNEEMATQCGKEIIEYYTRKFKKSDRILSVGAGFCTKEIGLIRMGYKNIVCSEPTVLASHIKKIYPELPVECCKGTNLLFPDESFDGCFSNSVIYCLSDEEINSMVKEMFRVTKPGGNIILLCASNQSLFASVYYMIKSKKIRTAGYKRSGWLRTYREVEKIILKSVPGIKVKKNTFKHETYLSNKLFKKADGRFNLLGKTIYYFSMNMVPLTNSYNVWELRK